MVYLKSVTYIKNNHSQLIDFLFSIPVMRNMDSISFNSNATIYEMENMYQGNLSEKSHGESFIEFFRSRLKPNSLYILD